MLPAGEVIVLPPEHSWQALATTAATVSENVPAGHCVQAVAPSPEKLPAPQIKQLDAEVAPVLGLYLPAGQSVQTPLLAP